MKQVVVIGGGSHAKEIADIIRASGDTVVGFLDDNPEVSSLGPLQSYDKFPEAEFIIGIGNANVRERLATEMKVHWYTAIHPSATVSGSASVGEGTVVMPNAYIGNGAFVGKHCIVNTAAVLYDESEMKDYAHLSVGAKTGENVQIGERTWVGIGAVIAGRKSVCGNVILGAGAVVEENIKEAGCYIGNPVRKLNRD